MNGLLEKMDKSLEAIDRRPPSRVYENKRAELVEKSKNDRVLIVTTFTPNLYTPYKIVSAKVSSAFFRFVKDRGMTHQPVSVFSVRENVQQVPDARLVRFVRPDVAP